MQHRYKVKLQIYTWRSIGLSKFKVCQRRRIAVCHCWIYFNPNLDVGFYNPEPGIIYPKEYSVDCQMTVLHEHSLGWTKSSNGGFKWLSRKDRFPYGVDKLTGGISICSGKASPATRPARNASKTNDNITKRLQSQVLNRRS